MSLRSLLPPVVWALVISALSQLSNPPGDPSFPAVSYGAHFVEFFILGLLLARAFRGSRESPASFVVWPAAVALAALFGMADEIHQAFVPGRDASPLDWLVDVGGAIGGVAFWAAGGVRGLKRRGNRLGERD